MSKRPYPECPGEQVLQDIAAGMAAREAVLEHTRHISSCDYCAPLLRRYIHDFSDEAPAADAAFLNQLRSSTAEWQKNWVNENIPGKRIEPVPARRAFSLSQWFRWPALAAAAAALIFVALVKGPAFIAAYQVSSANRQIAAAFAERRTLEPRMTGAPYAPYNPYPVEMGEDAQSSALDRPQLSAARAQIGERRKNGRIDPNWLQLEARVSLLGGTGHEVRQAEEDMEEARRKGLNTPSAKIDQASVYYVQETRANPDRPNLSRTINLLLEALKSSPLRDEDRRTALFNLALAYEKSELLPQAIATWNDYLKQDSASPWANEARQHLQGLQKRNPRAWPGDFKTPQFFLAHARDPAVLGEIESFQEFALAHWLPQSQADPAGSATQAIKTLAGVLQEQHSDPWFAQFIAALRPEDTTAVALLSSAVQHNHDDVAKALDEATEAATIFAGHHNLAGELRSRFEQVYAYQRSISAKECVAGAQDLEHRLQNTSYVWLQAQSALEMAACLNLNQQDPEKVKHSLSRSAELAERSRFQQTALREIGFQAAITRLRGDDDNAWRESLAGLRLYWQNPSAPERLYQFYTVMRLCAKDTGLMRTAQQLLRDGIKIREQAAPDDVGLRAALYLRLAHQLREENDEDGARTEAAKASALLRNADENTKKYVLAARMGDAEVELRKGRASTALQVLEQMRALPAIQHDLVILDYYRLLGEVQLKLRSLDAAAGAYRAGIQVADDELKSVSDPEGRLLWTKRTGALYRGLTRVLLEQNHSLQALETWEQFLGRSVENLPPGVNVQDIASHLPNRGMHLVYAVFKDGVQIWAVNRAGNQSSHLVSVPQEELEHSLKEFAQECSTPARSLDASRELYALLLEPAMAALDPAETLTVEPDPLLPSVAFEAIQSPDGKYFGDRFSIVYSRGMVAEAGLREPAPLHLDHLLLAVDASRSGASPLPGNEEALKAISMVYPRTRIIGPEHIAINEINQQLNNSYSFYFWGHARRDQTGSVLVLGSGAALTAGDFRPEELRHMEMAVLAACSSASAKGGMLDPGNLVRSLLAAGVPSVIASRWDVDSRSTAHLMKSFYTHLRQGMPIPDAMREARKDMMAAQLHPYYWAAFSVNGRAN